MKRCVLKAVMTMAFIFSLNPAAESAPAYGTKMPEKKQFFFGGQTHFVFERNLDQNRGTLSSTQHLFLISYGLLDWLSIDLKGAGGDVEQIPDNGNEIDYPAFVGGGYGFRIKLYDQDQKKAVFGFQHISIHPESIFVNETKHKTVLDDWQLSFLVSQEFRRFTPYMGGKWSRMDYIHWLNDDRERVKSDLSRSFGLIVGVDIPLTEKTWLNIEGQFLDVEALAASINFHF